MIVSLSLAERFSLSVIGLIAPISLFTSKNL